MVFLGIVCGLTKDGMKKHAPWGGCTRWGVLGGDGDSGAFHLLCGGSIEEGS